MKPTPYSLISSSQLSFVLETTANKKENLGPNAAKAVAARKGYDPDKTWMILPN